MGIIEGIQKKEAQKDMDINLSETLQEKINAILNQEETAEPAYTIELMYKACDIGQEVGFEIGFKTAFQLIAECFM